MTRGPRKPATKGGFSLLEALIALMVIATSFAAIYAALSDTARQSATRQSQYVATELAVSLLAEMRYRQAQISTLDAARYAAQWHWTLARAPSDQTGVTGSATAPFNLMTVTVWPPGARAPIILKELQTGSLP